MGNGAMKYSIEFLEKKFNMKLDSWQRNLVLSQKDFVLKTGRKCGKTTGMAFKIVFEALNNPNWKVCILSRGQRQSSEVFDQVLQWIKQIFPSDLPYESKSRLRLENGHIVLSLPTGYTGTTLRTYSFHKIYYDEAAYIPNDVYDATTPCLAVYGIQRILASTPAGTTGFFYKEWHNADFEKFEMETRQCTRVSKEWLQNEKKRMSKAQFAQEYEGKFSDMAAGLIRSELLYPCISEDIKVDQPEAVFLGVDIARFGESKNVIATNRYKEGISSITVEVFHGRFRTTAIVGKIANMVAKDPLIKKIVVDEAGVGGGPMDMLVEQFGKRKVIGVNNLTRIKMREETVGRPSRIMKEDLYSSLIRLMEDGKVKLDNDMAIIRSLLNMKFKYSSHGNLIIYGPETDVAEAIVRAVFPLMYGRPKKITVGWQPHDLNDSTNIYNTWRS